MKIILIQISPGVNPKGPIHSKTILVLNSVWLDTEQVTSCYLNNYMNPGYFTLAVTDLKP